MRATLAVVATLLVVLALGFVIGRRSVSTPKPVVVVHTTDDVSSFNDGFLDGRKDCR